MQRDRVVLGVAEQHRRQGLIATPGRFFLGIDPRDDCLEIQSLRSSPPGLAAADRARRRIFGAALEQFDELLVAAGSTRASVSPIPLFYALSQAGRAIAAVHVAGHDWRAMGHGLSVKSGTHELRDTVVEPHPGDSNQFRVFCAAIGSSMLTGPASIDELWASLPRLRRVPSLGADPPQVVPLTPRGSKDLFFSAALAGPLVADLPSDPEAARTELVRRLALYPGAVDDLGFARPFEVAPDHDGQPSVQLEWRAADGALRDVRSVAPGWGPSGNGSFLWPGLGPQRDRLAPLALLWLLLLALSNVARYDPDRWMRALARDTSEIALPIEHALELIQEIVPWLVLSALRGDLDSQRRAAG